MRYQVQTDDISLYFAKQVETLVYTISLKQLSDVMNVPMAAVRAIGRMEGAAVDSQSEYVDGHLLGAYADAYIRKLESYFRRMTSSKQLQSDPEEAVAFKQFISNYKKSTLRLSRVRTWDDIDTDKIRHEFCSKIKRHTHSQPRQYLDLTKYLILHEPKEDESQSSLVQIINNIGCSSFDYLYSLWIEELTKDCPAVTNRIEGELSSQQNMDVLRLVVRTKAYNNRFVNLPLAFLDQRSDIGRRIIRSLRYHTFASDDIPLPNVA